MCVCVCVCVRACARSFLGHSQYHGKPQCAVQVAVTVQGLGIEKCLSRHKGKDQDKMALPWSLQPFESFTFYKVISTWQPDQLFESLSIELACLQVEVGSLKNFNT